MATGDAFGSVKLWRLPSQLSQQPQPQELRLLQGFVDSAGEEDSLLASGGGGSEGGGEAREEGEEAELSSSKAKKRGAAAGAGASEDEEAAGLASTGVNSLQAILGRMNSKLEEARDLL